jgi:hypothetical protein
MAIKEVSACGKVRYTSEHKAIGAAIRSSRRGGLPLRVYQCPGCHGWHLTKRPVWHPSYGPKPAQPNGHPPVSPDERTDIGLVS